MPSASAGLTKFTEQKTAAGDAKKQGSGDTETEDPTAEGAKAPAPAVDPLASVAIVPIVVTAEAPVTPAKHEKSNETVRKAVNHDQATGEPSQPAGRDAAIAGQKPADAPSPTISAAFAREVPNRAASSTSLALGPDTAKDLNTETPGKSQVRIPSAHRQIPVSTPEAGTGKESQAGNTRAANAPVNDSSQQNPAVRFDAFTLQLQAAGGDGRAAENAAAKTPVPQSAAKQQPQSDQAANTTPQQAGQQQPGQQQSGQQHANESEKQPGAPISANRKDPQHEPEAAAPATGSSRAFKAASPDDVHLPAAPVSPRAPDVRPAGVQQSSETGAQAPSHGAEIVRQIEALRLTGVHLPRTVQDVEIRVPSPGNPVEVKLTDRGGNVEISVHSADPQLAQELRTQLPELIESLHSRGYEATNLERERPQQELAAPPNPKWSGPDDGAGGEASRRRDSQQQQGARRARAARDRAESEFSIEPEQPLAGIL